MSTLDLVAAPELPAPFRLFREVAGVRACIGCGGVGAVDHALFGPDVRHDRDCPLVPLHAGLLLILAGAEFTDKGLRWLVAEAERQRVAFEAQGLTVPS